MLTSTIDSNISEHTWFLNITTVCILDGGATLAADMAKEPGQVGPYTNVFCATTRLVDLLLDESSPVARAILIAMDTWSPNDYGAVQVDVEFLNGGQAWSPEAQFKLEAVDSEDYAFRCYRLID